MNLNSEQNFIVIEGLDGSGKSTQLKLLREYFYKHDLDHEYIHFPMLNNGYYGDLIAEYLRGEFGELSQVHPKLVALLFASDRKEHVNTLNNWLEAGKFILADRYVNSNIAFQSAKIPSIEDKNKLKEWILDFEFNFLKLPKPKIKLFLDVPFEFVQNALAGNRIGKDRDYLHGSRDIHEDSLELQKQVYREYLGLIYEQDNFIKVKCSDEHGKFLSPLSIHNSIVQLLREYKIL